MSVLLPLGIVLLGLAVGSFLNVVIDRLPADQSLISPPSHCPSCQRRLGPGEMIPGLSYLVLGGRCRTCGEHIPLRVWLVEIGTGVFYLLVWLRYGPTWTTGLYCLYGSLLITIGLIDLQHHKILNTLSYPALAVAALSIPLLPQSTLGGGLLGGAVGFGFLLLLAVISPGAMGFGDVKLVLSIGLITGFPEIILVLFLAFVSGGLVAGFLLLIGQVTRKDPIAFGPYLVLAGMTTLLYGEPILNWWMRRFGG